MAGSDVATDEETEKDTKDSLCKESSKSDEHKEEIGDVKIKEIKANVEESSLAQEKEIKAIEDMRQAEKENVENLDKKTQEKVQEETLKNKENKVEEKEANLVALEEEKSEEKVENITKEKEEAINVAEKEKVENNMDNNNIQEKEEQLTKDVVDSPIIKKRKVPACEENVKESEETSATPLKVEQDENIVKDEKDLVLQNGEISKDTETKEGKEIKEIKPNKEHKEVVAEEVNSPANVKTECTEKEEKSALNEKQHDDEEEKEKEKSIETTITTKTKRNYEYHEAIEDTDNIDDEDDENQINENISDEVMAKRHERALTEERRKFQTYLKFPWTTRSRANRRGDSRAESSGANTPDPASPAPAASTTTTTTAAKVTTATTTTNLGSKYQENSIPSTTTTTTTPETNTSTNTTTTTQFTSVEGNNMSTAVTFNDQFAQSTNKDNTSNSPNYRTGARKRCRTTSSKRGEQEARSLTPDSREILPPYEPLKFPLSDEAFDNMVRLLPMDKYTETNMTSSSSTKFEISNNATIMTNNSRKSVLVGFGRGRSGLRRQSRHSSSYPIRSNSLRTRLSNRPYVLNKNNSSNVQNKAKDQEEFVGVEENKNINAKNENKTTNRLHINGKHLLNNTTADDMAEETEDETETCEFGDDDIEAAETDCDDDDNDYYEEEEDDDLDDDDDDGFLKHPLATADYNIHDQIAVAAGIDKSVTSFARQHHGEENTFAAAYGDQSDMDSSEPEPFQEDDDPNDPEWGDNNMRMRKKI